MQGKELDNISLTALLCLKDRMSFENVSIFPIFFFAPLPGQYPHQHTTKLSIFAEKGILKKPGPPYCPLDKDRWDDRLSSSSQNNLVNLTGGMVDSGSRQQMQERPDSRRTEISDVERTLKSLNGYHEDILEVGPCLEITRELIKVVG